MTILTQHQFMFTLDNGVGGSLTDYSSQITECEVPQKINAGEHFTYDIRHSKRSVGGLSTSIKVTVRVETTATSLYGILVGIGNSGTITTYNGTISFLLGTPATTGTGAHTWAGECKVISMGGLKTKAGEGAIQTCQFELGGDGAITYAVA